MLVWLVTYLHLQRVLSGEEKGKRKLLLAVMSSTLKENGGGVRDLYGEDSATEEQLITPWSFSVARYIT